MTHTRLIAIGVAGIALICTAPIIGTLAQLAAGAFLDWAGAVRETHHLGKPCAPYHNASDLAGFLLGFNSIIVGAAVVCFAVYKAADMATKEKP